MRVGVSLRDLFFCRLSRHARQITSAHAVASTFLLRSAVHRRGQAEPPHESRLDVSRLPFDRRPPRFSSQRRVPTLSRTTPNVFWLKCSVLPSPAPGSLDDCQTSSWQFIVTVCTISGTILGPSMLQCSIATTCLTVAERNRPVVRMWPAETRMQPAHH